MRLEIKCYFVLVCLCDCVVSEHSKKSNSIFNIIQKSHKQCVEDISFMRRKYPDVQPKAYRVLDQLDKIQYASKKLLKNIQRKKEKYNELKFQYDDQEVKVKELCKIRDIDNVALQNEVAAHKGVLDIIQKKLVDKTKELDDKNELIKKLEEKVVTLTKLTEEKAKEKDEGKKIEKNKEMSNDKKSNSVKFS